MLYLVGPLFESRFGDCVFDRRLVIFLTFSRQVATQFPKRHYMRLAHTEFCKYLSVITEIIDINLASQTADFTARIYMEFATA